ncbi:hypothetical protein AnigIFM63604_005046 [Aspergillus niger]|uniref:Uncharacterized protein n=1 Tax=Aspergillus niger TaxID=5061 RepID=A0A3F3RNT7_ASPNG|nr:hypothetical protein CBS12448_10295 [Aspergillus niger]KAI2874412.1 hypothetical protein CBS11852_10663 [Aspergillus niger]KAI2937247.1 hypothetical protein CBS147321_7962 [Aspergillus niger]KAI2944543.1 hypothetical protein CBS147322_8072 [Aspergillus niger]KAI2989164.1 hypothetical protein CBS147345_10631 [Aspergillus niger]
MASWLTLERDSGGWAFVDYNGLRRIVSTMDRPQEKYPSVLLFVGGSTKMQALRALYPYNNIGRPNRHGLARVHLSELPRQDPVVVIESSLLSAGKASSYQTACTRWHHIRGSHGQSFKDMRDLAYRQVLVPLAHIVCLFLADLKGLNSVQGIQDLLSAWKTPEAARLDKVARLRPCLIVVLTDCPDRLETCESIQRTLSSAAVPDLVSSISVVDLRHRSELSVVSRFLPLQQALEQQRREALTVRAKAHLLFSATHVEAIAKLSLIHAAQWPTSTLDYIKAARSNCSEGTSATQYIQLFLNLADCAGIQRRYVVTAIASALLMDAYPPGMHEFEPIETFRTLYAEECRHACSNWPPPVTRAFVQAIEREFVLLFAILLQAQGSAQVRADILRQAAATWASLKPSNICLFCLRRPPEHVLPCGHAICDTCACIFGRRGCGAEYHIEVIGCRLCQAPFSFVVRLLPPTKRPILLVLDGGGIRGVITLGFLTALEEQLGGAQGLREAFDLAVGTSAGAVIAAETIICGTRANEARSKFEVLARRIFPVRRRWQTLFGKSWDFLTTWVADSRHDSQILDETLQKAFGAKRRLFDTTWPMISGIRVALTASREADGALCLLCNYRGATRSQGDSAYRVPVLYQALLCETYFTPKYLDGVGFLQDGGVTANCPLRAALRESQIIWPSRTQPDLVVSIGTGYTPEGPANEAERAGQQIRGGFIARAVRTFLSSSAVDGRRGWLDAWDGVPESIRPDVFRLDQAITGSLPELDDTRALEDLAKFSYHVPDELTRAWLAKSFFFELDKEPAWVNGGFLCQGSILCCRYDAASLVHQIVCQFSEPRYTCGGRDLGAVDNSEGCVGCGYYRKCVTIQVASMHEDLQLGITGLAGFRTLGGFPTSIHALLNDQQADAPFGRADHSQDRWPPLRRCYCSSRKRSGNLMIVDRAATKRRRLN